jgi:hypothetical protein
MAGITPLFSNKDIAKMFGKFGERTEAKLLQIMQYTGEAAVKAARESGNYTDQTGNLRSSIGYIIAKNGTEVAMDFQEASKGSDKQTGYRAGRILAQTLTGQFSTGYALIVVAGMDYAVAVEAKGRDVLTFAESSAKGSLESIIKKLL